MQICIHLIRIYALASLPIIPYTATNIFDALNMSRNDRMTKISESVNFNTFAPGHQINVIPPLFRKLDDAEIQELLVKFGKGQSR